MLYRAYTLTATIVAPHHIGDADHCLRVMLSALPDGDVLNAGVEFDDPREHGGLGGAVRLDLAPRYPILIPPAPLDERVSANPSTTTAWTPAGHDVPAGAHALFSLPTLAYQPPDGTTCYREAYVGRVSCQWHDAYEFIATTAVIEAIARRLPTLAGQFAEVTFDGTVLNVQLPPSLGSGVRETEEVAGGWVVGWALQWHPVAPHACDKVIN